jgi:AcrR family transcriptional regulator
VRALAPPAAGAEGQLTAVARRPLTTGVPAADRRPRRGRPARIDIDDIVRAGAAIGLPALSVTAVAEALGVSPPSLYRHVRDRDALEALVGEHLTAGYELPRDRGQPWADYLVELGHSLRELLLAHPGLGRYLQRLGAESAGTLRIIDHCDQVLVSRGLAPVEALLVGATVANFAVAAVERQQAMATPSAAEAIQRFSTAVEAIGPDRLPTLVRAVSEFRQLDPDVYFDWSLRCLVDGMAARLAAGRSPLDAGPGPSPA